MLTRVPAGNNRCRFPALSSVKNFFSSLIRVTTVRLRLERFSVAAQGRQQHHQSCYPECRPQQEIPGSRYIAIHGTSPCPFLAGQGASRWPGTRRLKINDLAMGEIRHVSELPWLVCVLRHNPRTQPWDKTLGHSLATPSQDQAALEVPSTSRNLAESNRMVNGFCTRMVPGLSTPLGER